MNAQVQGTQKGYHEQSRIDEFRRNRHSVIAYDQSGFEASTEEISIVGMLDSALGFEGQHSMAMGWVADTVNINPVEDLAPTRTNTRPLTAPLGTVTQ